MGSFIKNIEADGRTIEFSFMRIFTVDGVKFFVTTHDKGGRPVLFQMEVKKGEWKIINAPKVPEWIIRKENELSNSIIENNPFSQ